MRHFLLLTFCFFLFVILPNSPGSAKGKGRSIGKSKKKFPPIADPVPDAAEIASIRSSRKDIAGGIFSIDTGIKNPSVELNATIFVDTVMEVVRRKMTEAGMEEITPPDLDAEVSGCSLGISDTSIKGATAFHRIGDVVVKTTPLYTTFAAGFGFKNITLESNIKLKCGEVDYPNGRVTTYCDKVTIKELFKFAHVTQGISLEEFEFDLGDCHSDATGLGEKVESAVWVANDVFKETKGPVIEFFNLSFKVVVNIALAAAKAAIFLPAVG